MKINKETMPVGTRALIKLASYSSLIHEVTVEEWTESGKYVKLKYPSGNSTWEEYVVRFGELVEILPNS